MITDIGFAIGNKEEKDYTFEHKFGANPNVTAGSETIWTYGGLYPWSAWDTAGTISLVSTSGSDTSELTVYGLDENWNLYEETFTLTGTTPVVSTSTWKRIYRMIYAETNVGTLTANKSGSVVSHIQVGKAQTLICAYTVPAGYTAYGVQWTVGCGKGGDAEFQLFTRDNYYGGGGFRIRGQLEVYESTFTQTYASVFPLTQKTDIDLRTLTTTNNFKATGSFDLILRKH